MLTFLPSSFSPATSRHTALCFTDPHARAAHASLGDVLCQSSPAVPLLASIMLCCMPFCESGPHTTAQHSDAEQERRCDKNTTLPGTGGAPCWPNGKACAGFATNRPAHGDCSVAYSSEKIHFKKFGSFLLLPAPLAFSNVQTAWRGEKDGLVADSAVTLPTTGLTLPESKAPSKATTEYTGSKGEAKIIIFPADPFLIFIILPLSPPLHRLHCAQG